MSGVLPCLCPIDLGRTVEADVVVFPIALHLCGGRTPVGRWPESPAEMNDA